VHIVVPKPHRPVEAKSLGIRRETHPPIPFYPLEILPSGLVKNVEGALRGAQARTEPKLQGLGVSAAAKITELFGYLLGLVFKVPQEELRLTELLLSARNVHRVTFCHSLDLSHHQLLVIGPRLLLPIRATHLGRADHLGAATVLADQMLRQEVAVEARAGEATLRPCSCGHGMWGKGVGLGHGAHSVLAARSQGENQGVCRRSGRLVRPCSPYPTLTGANALQGVPRSPSAFDDRWAGRDERCAVKRMFIGLSNPSISATGTFPPTFPGFSLSTAIPRQLPIYPCRLSGAPKDRNQPVAGASFRRYSTLRLS